MAQKTPWLQFGAALLLVFGAYLLVSRLDLETVLHPNHVAAWLREAGPFGPILFIGLMATAVVISPIPSLPLDIAAGATFGPMLGTAYAVFGAEIGAIASFLIGRMLGHDVLAKLLHTNVTFCERCSDRHLAIFVLLARLVPLFSFDVISYGAGLTNMSLRTFALTTFVGMIPPTFALTYAGSQVASGAWLMILSGLAMVAVMLLLPKLVVRYPTARWVQLIRGGMPAALAPDDMGTAAKTPCSSCGGPLV